MNCLPANESHEILSFDFPTINLSCHQFHIENQAPRLYNFLHVQLQFILLINVKMPTIVEILSFDFPTINLSCHQFHIENQAPRLYNFFHAQLQFILLINVKMPIIVGILTFISIINTTSESLKARKVFIFQHFSFYDQLKFHAQLS